jgi:hypothetical protein
VRRDVQAVFVLDASRSMLAAPPGGPTRFQRARAAALELRSGLPEVPVGIASLTDRMLPHLFPTPDAAAFDTVLERAVGPDRPPPGSLWTRATSFEPLADLVTRNYFGRRVSRRVVVVFTDGESRRVSVPVLAQSLRQVEGVRLLFVRFWSRTERVRVRGERPESYRPDPRSGPELERLAHALGGDAVDEHHLSDAQTFLRDAVGHGRLARRETERDSLALAPIAVALCLVPLSFLLWTRNRA